MESCRLKLASQTVVKIRKIAYMKDYSVLVLTTKSQEDRRSRKNVCAALPVSIVRTLMRSLDTCKIYSKLIKHISLARDALIYT